MFDNFHCFSWSILFFSRPPKRRSNVRCYLSRDISKYFLTSDLLLCLFHNTTCYKIKHFRAVIKKYTIQCIPMGIGSDGSLAAP